MAGQLRLYSLAQPSYAGAFAELGNIISLNSKPSKSYGQHATRDCEPTRSLVTNWLYLFFVPLASFNLLM